MLGDVTVLIADAQHIPAVRAECPFPGPVLYFSSGNLASALESIRAHAPKIVAIESQFAQSPAGRAFLDRLRVFSLAGSEIHLLGRANRGWSSMPLSGPPPSVETPAAAETPAEGLNTRRTPRFALVSQVEALVDGTSTGLVDISVLGAQVLSAPTLRPKQRIRVTIIEENDVLRFTAHVAWSIYETSRAATTPHYRAGMEFDDAIRQALEEFCRRHCSDTPLKFR